LRKTKFKGKLYYGAKYFPLRKELVTTKLKAENQRNEILISFGGADPNNLTLKILKAFKDSGRDMHIKVLIGPAFQAKSRNKILSLSKSLKNAQIIDGTANLTEVFQDVKFVFTALGVSIYEFNYLKLPVILLYNYRTDAKDATILEERGIVKNLGYYEKVTDRKIIAETFRFIENKIRVRRCVDGQGAERICRIILGE